MRIPLAVIGFTLAGCPSGGFVRTYPAPTIADVVARFAKERAKLTSFSGQSVMEYWLGKDRVKGEVLVMGKPGARVRFAALSPAGSSTLAEMACDGKNFAYLDLQKNCQLTGPCDQNSIAQFLRVQLDPEDFVALALGTPPILANPTGTVTWNDKTGHEMISLSSPEGKQQLEIDARDGKWDVVESTRMTTDGKLVLKVKNYDFATVKDEAGAPQRVPNKSHVESPQEHADLSVEWKERALNKEIADDKFVMTIPTGLPSCK
jgi:outer membrane lipoprotein-sorting protein